MNVFFVIFPPNSTLTEAGLASFKPNVHSVVPERVWAIGTNLQTGDAVGQKIGIGPAAGQDATAVIIKLGDYNGFASRSLWENISLWMGS